MGLENGKRGGAAEWRGPRGQLMKDATQRVQVRTGIEGQRIERLGRHVVGRADEGEGVPVDPDHRARPGQPEVDQLGHVSGRDQHVGRFQVAVDQAPMVGCLETPSDAPGDARQPGLWQRSFARQQRLQAGPLDQLHDDDLTPLDDHQIVNTHDVLVLQPLEQARLPAEPFGGARIVPERVVENLAGVDCARCPARAPEPPGRARPCRSLRPVGRSPRSQPNRRAAPFRRAARSTSISGRVSARASSASAADGWSAASRPWLGSSRLGSTCARGAGARACLPACRPPSCPGKRYGPPWMDLRSGVRRRERPGPDVWHGTVFLAPSHLLAGLFLGLRLPRRDGFEALCSCSHALSLSLSDNVRSASPG